MMMSGKDGKKIGPINSAGLTRLLAGRVEILNSPLIVFPPA